MVFFLSYFAFLHSNFFCNPKGCCHSKFVCLSYIICFNMSYHCIHFLSYISQLPLIYFRERMALFCLISYHQSFQLINDKVFFISNFSFDTDMYLYLTGLQWATFILYPLLYYRDVIDFLVFFTISGFQNFEISKFQNFNQQLVLCPPRFFWHPFSSCGINFSACRW